MTELSYVFYFIVINAMTCRTNTLWQYLQHQPATLLFRDIRSAVFFDGISNWKKTIYFYQRHFTNFNYFNKCQNYLLSLQKSFSKNIEHLITSQGNKRYRYSICIHNFSQLKRLSGLDNSDWTSATGASQAHA